VGTNDTVFITGYSSNAVGSDIVTVAYSSSGTSLWANRFNAPGSTNDAAQGLTVGTDGNLYITVYSSESTGSRDLLTLAYSSAGIPLWTNRYGISGGPNTQGRVIATGPSGNIYVSGITGSDMLTIKYVLAPNIVFSAVKVLPDGTCSLTLSAPTNVAYRIDASADLLSWQTVTNLPPLPVTSMQLTDALAPSFSTRFYRAVWTP